MVECRILKCGRKRDDACKEVHDGNGLRDVPLEVEGDRGVGTRE